MVRKQLLVIGILVLVAFGTLAIPPAQADSRRPRNIQAQLHPVGGSGVSGFVNLRQRQSSGTHITVVAFGLTPGKTYVSLYYDNHVCELEPYSADDVVGGIYTANRGTVGTTEGNADDNLAEINSVSVRRAGTFELLACANVHPGH
jgi:hypothetical protein